MFRDDGARAGLAAVLETAAVTAVECPRAWDDLRLNEALEHIWNVIERANEFVDRTKPWELGKDPARLAELGTVLSALLETLRLTAIWAWPAMPKKCEELWNMLGYEGSPREQRGDAAQPHFGPVAPRKLGETRILFPRIDLKQATGA